MSGFWIGVLAVVSFPALVFLTAVLVAAASGAMWAAAEVVFTHRVAWDANKTAAPEHRVRGRQWIAVPLRQWWRLFTRGGVELRSIETRRGEVYERMGLVGYRKRSGGRPDAE